MVRSTRFAITADPGRPAIELPHRAEAAAIERDVAGSMTSGEHHDRGVRNPAPRAGRPMMFVAAVTSASTRSAGAHGGALR
jgi:hypothetical protein